MILKPAEVIDLRGHLTARGSWSETTWEERDAAVAYLEKNPHLLVATYFNEYAPPRTLDKSVGHPSFRLPGGRWVAIGWPTEAGLQFVSDSWVQQNAEALARTGRNFGALLTGRDLVMTITFDELLSRLQLAAGTPPDGPCSITSPLLWTPEAQRTQKVLLKDATEAIIKAVWRQHIDLRSVPWRQLEEIVAELLQAQGLDVHLVTERPQGGRDIIARGELIPGWEPLTIAVEVKQRELVGRPEVHMALHQNRFFPALLFVTAGRFTAGVFHEQRRDENQLRLFLKDGVALKDMIDLYSLRTSKDTSH